MHAAKAFLQAKLLPILPRTHFGRHAKMMAQVNFDRANLTLLA
jgi:hypothetical protein